jgi:hypothetical protein
MAEDSNQTKIIVAIIGAVGVVAVGLFANYEKIFGPPGVPPGVSEAWIDGGTNDVGCTKICEAHGKVCKTARRKIGNVLAEVGCEFWRAEGSQIWKECLCI